MAQTQKEISVLQLYRIKLFVSATFLIAIISLFYLIKFTSGCGYPLFQFYLLNVLNLPNISEHFLIADCANLFLKVVMYSMVIAFVFISVEMPDYSQNLAPLPGPNARTQVVYVYK